MDIVLMGVYRQCCTSEQVTVNLSQLCTREDDFFFHMDITVRHRVGLLRVLRET